MSDRERKDVWWRNEDWVAVWLGFIIIALILAGVRFSFPKFSWTGTEQLLGSILTWKNILSSIIIGLLYLVLSALGVWLTGGNILRYILGFPIIFALSWLSLLVAGNSAMNNLGLEYVIFALLIGLFISNVIGVPSWLKEAIRTEYYIKTGLVILGTSILFYEILQAGVLGIIQALLVVFVVWHFSYGLSKRLRIDDEFAVMLSTAVSICGVSAAIAACGAIKGDRKKLSYVTSLVLIVAIPMMIFMPWIGKTLGLSDMVIGAWLGGTIDTTGAVVAAGALVSETAMKSATIVKFSQNVLIGVAAFIISVWWTLSKTSQSPTDEKPSLKVIWERFPKFVIGFMIASFIFSFLVDPATVKGIKGLLGGLRNLWFALAFVSIGLETRFSELVKMEQGRPALAFILAQTFNIFWTLAIAYLLFGGVFFPPPSIQ
ncbi:hypothetical protein HRbin19_01018 [bacterium HR19]|nr:hypothetical protein HRbin19_01018 [bacterium HR19]